ncbi:hypothetical protein PG993_012194 [Apiospora rasikravindrae]|uniref:Actin cortical patch protein n=1 Tax=Apiospora rasikravindrae TaxID=990691 RepID=A0ABR1S280_9PEZI
MELTPIRIPGKRRKKGEPPPPKKAKRDVARDQAMKKHKSKPSKPKGSYLERELPLEILERIFWASETANLAKASPRIGHMLSGPATRRATFLNAFGPTWDVWFGCLKSGPGVKSYYGWQEDSSRFGGSPEFQSSLLEYSWVDVSFIMECWDLWVKRHGRDRFFQHQKLWGSPDTPNRLDSSDPDGLEGSPPPSGMAYFLHDYDSFVAKSAHNMTYLGDHTSLIEVHCDTEIPDKLLTGPWDEAAVKKLFWLVRAGARLSATQTWESTLEGYHTALSEETEPPTGRINVPVIRLLLKLGGTDHWPKNVLSKELGDLFERAGRVPDEARLKYQAVYYMIASKWSAESL